MYQSDLKHPSRTLEDKLHRLYTLNRNKKMDLGFRPPYLRLLEKLGNPQNHLPPVIHVAGTNGKGSIIAMLRACLEHAGYKTHAYTSPHLVRFNERIVLTGQEIADGPLEALIDEALELNAGGDLTFFEITTAIAFAAFARTPADICLLEVGMGGRLDCTNVVENPALTIISAIGIDHQEWLGDTIEEIAAEKAGIIKPGAPCILAPQKHESAAQIIRNRAKERDAPLFEISQIPELQPPLPGSHQQYNLATALKALECLHKDFPLQDNQILSGLKNTRWPARLQKLDPAALNMPAGFEIYLDGGHNADAGNAIAAQCAEWKKNGKPLFVILGMMDGKDVQGFTAPILPLADKLYTVNIENESQSHTSQSLGALLPTAIPAQNFQTALSSIKNSHKAGRVLICGSLYLAGHVLKALQK